MFHNLIESSSHTQELKRRGSFVLFTTATYMVLFVITGAVSIYAYDARLEDQSFDIVINMLPPMEVNAAPAINRLERPRSDNNNKAIVKPPIEMSSVNDPKVFPEGVSVMANPPLPEIRFKGRGGDGPGSSDGNGPGSDGSRSGSRNGPAEPGRVVMAEDPPPVPEIPKPQPRIISKGVITGQATFLPKPAYPPIAKRLGIRGTVSVQVLVDESGRVVSARALAGSPFLVGEAQKAALQARFSPALLSGQPVKVSGVITYNFVMQ